MMESRKMSIEPNNLGIKLSLKTKLINFEIF